MFTPLVNPNELIIILDQESKEKGIPLAFWYPCWK